MKAYDVTAPETALVAATRGMAALIYGNFYPRETPTSQSGNLEVTLLSR